jgi:hypothetical protein
MAERANDVIILVELQSSIAKTLFGGLKLNLL